MCAHVGLITVKSTRHQANIKTLTTRTMLRDDQWHVTRRVRGLSTHIVGIYSDLSGLEFQEINYPPKQLIFYKIYILFAFLSYCQLE